MKNILATRYASQSIVDLWLPETKVILERELWVTVLEAQVELGLDVDESVISAYRAVIDQVDLVAISDRERATRHDVKARLEEFCSLAGHEQIHRGMTSRDLTENVEQLQIYRSLDVILDKIVSALARLGRLASEHSDLVIAGRTHNVIAQPTTLGKRFANTAEELLVAYRRMADLVERYPLRGLKGPVGTQQDQLDLFHGDAEKVQNLERMVAKHLGFEWVFNSVGQIYPRSLDFDVLSTLFQSIGGPANLSRTIRLMAGHDLVTEGFQAGQVGSSAMPHKINTRTCERINGLSTVLRGYLTMVEALVGDQWNEGDVTCSVVRRVALPDAFMATDGLFESFLTVLDEFAVFPKIAEFELRNNLPFLATTRILMAAVEAGVGREVAHEVISGYAIKAVENRRTIGSGISDYLDWLADDDRLPLNRSQLDSLLADRSSLIGRAPAQVQEVIERIAEVVTERPRAAIYNPEPIF